MPKPSKSAEDTRAVCIECGREHAAGKLVATSVGYKCAKCARPVAKIRRPFKHPVVMALLADDGFTYITRPLCFALGAGMLLGFVMRGLVASVTLPWLPAASGVLLGFLIGEVTRLGAGDRPLRLHAVVAAIGVLAAAAVSRVAFAPMALGAVLAALWLLVPADLAV